ncbi:MAG TPA: hypothetical protein VLG66_02800 [Alphaproteobacteria bacterium]|nr:hypothetical protein [Alphaproteobacteria bacterium]
MIDQPWNAPGELGDTRDEIACKQIGPGIASELESMPNIRLDFGGRETLEMGHYGDPLTYVGSLEVEAGLENLLASKDRLDAVPAVIGRLAERDEVAQQRRGTVIGLVNQNGRQRISASGAPASADGGDELSAIFRFARNAQFLGPPIEDIVDAGSRLRNDKGDAAGVLEVSFHLAQQGRLAGSAVAQDEQQSPPADQSCSKFVEPRPHRGSHEEELRVGRNPERILFQAERTDDHLASRQCRGTGRGDGCRSRRAVSAFTDVGCITETMQPNRVLRNRLFAFAAEPRNSVIIYPP